MKQFKALIFATLFAHSAFAQFLGLPNAYPDSSTPGDSGLFIFQKTPYSLGKVKSIRASQLKAYMAVGSGTVTSVSGANGIAVASPTTTPIVRIDSTTRQALGTTEIKRKAQADSGLTVNGYANAFATTINGSGVSGQSYGLRVTAGKSVGDNTMYVEANGINVYRIRGDGLTVYSRSFPDSGLVSAHSIEDLTTINPPDSNSSYAFIDVKTQVPLLYAKLVDHLGGFQARQNFLGSNHNVKSYGFLSEITVNSTARLDTNFGVQLRDISGSGSVGVNIGLQVRATTRGDTNYALLLLNPAATNSWNIHAAGTAKNYLEGSLGVGVATPATKIEARQAGYGEGIRASYSGVSAGIGVGGDSSLFAAQFWMNGSIAASFASNGGASFGSYAGQDPPANGLIVSGPMGVGARGHLITHMLDVAGTAGITGALSALSLTTGAPSGGTAAAWKFGVKVTAASVVDATQYLQVDIGGTPYKLVIAQ